MPTVARSYERPKSGTATAKSCLLPTYILREPKSPIHLHESRPLKTRLLTFGDSPALRLKRGLHHFQLLEH